MNNISDEDRKSVEEITNVATVLLRLIGNVEPFDEQKVIMEEIRHNVRSAISGITGNTYSHKRNNGLNI